MKVQVSTQTLAATVAQLERVVPARSSNPGLSSLLIRLTPEHVILSGTNLEIDLEAYLSCDAQGEGTWAVPAHVFGQVVRALPADTVELTFGDRELQVVSGSFDTKLQLTEASQTPRLTFPEEYEGNLPGGLLASILGNVRYASAVNDYQAVFRGIRLELHENHTRAIASDGFRLAWSHQDANSGLDADLIIPARAAEEIVRLLDDSGEAGLSLGGGQLSLKTKQYRMNVKLMEGTFPDYQRVIPKQLVLEVTMSSTELQQAVSRVAVLSDAASNNRMDIYLSEDSATFTAEGNFGGAKEVVALKENAAGGQLALSFNARFLLEAIKPLTGDVQLGFSGTTTPSIVKGIADPGYLAMIVPLKTVVD